MMSEQLCQINIDDIDLNDLQYKISLTDDDISFLAQSIKQTGLINPPIVRPVNNKYIIVTGFNRIKASVVNNENSILAYIIKPNSSDVQCLVKSITSLCFKRQLSQAELILSIKRLNKFLDEKQMANKSVAIFNTRLNERFIKDLLNIASLPDLAIKLLHQGNISLKTAKKMLLFEKEVIKNFLKIFSIIKASNNKQLEIIQYINEICKRDSINLEVFFQNQEILDILFDEKSEPVLKTKLLRNYLFKKRFPALFNTRQEVQKKINNLKLGNNIKLLPPENFENPNYLISFTAKDYNEFNANILNLNKIKENNEIKKIFTQTNKL